MLKQLRNMSVEILKLHCPSLNDISKVLKKRLIGNFATVEVNVTDCPNLTAPPFHLAAAGLCGSTRIVDVGGPPYLLPLPQLDKVYNIADIAKRVNLPSAFIIGAGAGPYNLVGVNSELIPNLKLDPGCPTGCSAMQSYISKVDLGDGSCIQETINSTDFSILGNFFFSEGAQGKVLEVKAKERIGEENLISCIRKALSEEYGDQPVGIGGAFLIERGKAKIHIMSDFSKEPLENDEAVDEWLKFYEMSAPLVCLTGECVSADPGMDLRVEHTHCFSQHGEGGHYHYDTTPEEVAYHGFFNVAECLYRVDRPGETHDLGRV
ncbi:PREDICTED: ester hydrolase C11orf54 homolog [Priapulus caudatus]|uniref:Ester hydrolase C11orf54 homolog n=1 Tax=Priapulus caudatus TaxID=37621 RepID=A0ABM1E280_PRICU|nr:PREDICTED: ester hydrolase C11orf54 homolog [Priapulus caudatus]